MLVMQTLSDFALILINLFAIAGILGTVLILTGVGIARLHGRYLTKRDQVSLWGVGGIVFGLGGLVALMAPAELLSGVRVLFGEGPLSIGVLVAGAFLGLLFATVFGPKFDPSQTSAFPFSGWTGALPQWFVRLPIVSLFLPAQARRSAIYYRID